jgi:hypothetical protein
MFTLSDAHPDADSPDAYPDSDVDPDGNAESVDIS